MREDSIGHGKLEKDKADTLRSTMRVRLEVLIGALLRCVHGTRFSRPSKGPQHMRATRIPMRVSEMIHPLICSVAAMIFCGAVFTWWEASRERAMVRKGESVTVALQRKKGHTTPPDVRDRSVAHSPRQAVENLAAISGSQVRSEL